MFVMLQKKLQELESELGVVFRLPLDQMAAEHMSSDDVKERFRFLDKLRAAEAGSQHPQNSDQLRDIDDRIARLKAAFSDWNMQSRSCGFNNNDDDDEDDAPSICSDCTLQALPLEDFSSHNLLEKEEKKAAAPAVVAARIGRYCGAFGGGMIVGALCMLFKLFCADYLILDDQPFLIPPT